MFRSHNPYSFIYLVEKDMPFRQEIDKIEEYTRNIHNTSILVSLLLNFSEGTIHHPLSTLKYLAREGKVSKALLID
jgi:hypothetical protein